MNVRGILSNCKKVSTPLLNYQSVRWRKSRKPFWLGFAKSKMFVVPESRRKLKGEEENNEKLRLDKEYSTQVKSLLNFMTKEDPLQGEGNQGFHDATNEALLMKEIEESYLRNESWNAASAKLREERIENSLKEHMESAESIITLSQEKEKKRLELFEKYVKEEKEKSKFFVTLENLDDMIEKCLNELVEYNFAIDLQGNKYPGKDPILNLANKSAVKVSEPRENV